jgi:hypothetical protein
LIGYTCAGKSTLFNKLTKSNVLESTKPFSTLNPTTRKTYLSDKTEILLSDTVGFITDLPEDLISSFTQEPGTSYNFPTESGSQAKHAKTTKTKTKITTEVKLGTRRSLRFNKT